MPQFGSHTDVDATTDAIVIDGRPFSRGTLNGFILNRAWTSEAVFFLSFIAFWLLTRILVLTFELFTFTFELGHYEYFIWIASWSAFIVFDYVYLGPRPHWNSTVSCCWLLKLVTDEGPREAAQIYFSDNAEAKPEIDKLRSFLTAHTEDLSSRKVSFNKVVLIGFVVLVLALPALVRLYRGYSQTRILSPVSPEKFKRQIYHLAVHLDRQYRNGYLTTLGISNPTDEDVRRLQNLHYLETLRLYDSAITHEGFKTIARLDRIEGLVINGGHVTHKGLANLSRCKSLELLNITNVEVEYDGLVHLKDCDALRTLYLRNTDITPAEVTELQKLMPQCTFTVE